MPPSSSPSKKPGILAWIGFIVLALVILVVLFAIIASFMRPGTHSSTVTSGGGPDVARMMAPTYEAAPAAPSTLADNGIEATQSETGGLDTAAPPAGAADNQATQQVIKTGEISLRVTDASKAVDDIGALATGKGGFVESSSISDSGTGPRNAWVTIRVPVAAFDDAMKALKQVGVLVLDESVHGQDVTQEFVDLNADLTNAKAEEQSYLDILKRTGSIEDVLAVTARLADVRGRIERLQGTQRYLADRTDLATIAVSLTEETRVEVPGRTWKPLEVVRTALSDLVASLQALVDFLIRLVIGLIGLLLPVALLTFLSIWIIWKIVKAVIRRFRR